MRDFPQTRKAIKICHAATAGTFAWVALVAFTGAWWKHLPYAGHAIFVMYLFTGFSLISAGFNLVSAVFRDGSGVEIPTHEVSSKDP